jgi:hypothetical protein
MWFKWKNPDIDPSRSFEFMNAFELWGHILTYETEKPPSSRFSVIPSTPRISSSPSRTRPPTTPRWCSSPTAGAWR